MDNGAAKKEGFALNLQATGDLYGDMFEVSTIRKEDYEFIKDKSGEFVDVLQVIMSHMLIKLKIASIKLGNVSLVVAIRLSYQSREPQKLEATYSSILNWGKSVTREDR